MNNNPITPEDVKNVAKSIKIELSDAQVNEVLKLYPSEEVQDSTATWDLIIENCIYQTITLDCIIDDNLL